MTVYQSENLDGTFTVWDDEDKFAWATAMAATIYGDVYVRHTKTDDAETLTMLHPARTLVSTIPPGANRPSWLPR